MAVTNSQVNFMPIPPTLPDHWNPPPRRAFTYYDIPATLTELARQITADVRSIACYDARQQPRPQPLSADKTAALLLDWALDVVQRNPALLPRSGAPRLKLWNCWEKPTPMETLPPPPVRNPAQARTRYIAYRWPPAIDQAIRRLAHARGLRIGETVLRLLEIAIQSYLRYEFEVVQEPLNPRS